jgi:hypothetical protein
VWAARPGRQTEWLGGTVARRVCTCKQGSVREIAGVAEGLGTRGRPRRVVGRHVMHDGVCRSVATEGVNVGSGHYARSPIREDNGGEERTALINVEWRGTECSPDKIGVGFADHGVSQTTFGGPDGAGTMDATNSATSVDRSWAGSGTGVGITGAGGVMITSSSPESRPGSACGSGERRHRCCQAGEPFARPLE